MTILASDSAPSSPSDPKPLGAAFAPLRFWWLLAGLVTLGGLLLGALRASLVPRPAPVVPPAPSPLVPPLPGPVPANLGLAPQKVRLQLSDGRTATFCFLSSGGTLCCTAAVGLDEVLAYDLLPADGAWPPLPPPPPPEPPTPGPDPAPPTPAPANLRILFLYDPLALADMPPGQVAILASPKLRSYLQRHCPLESGCVSGRCPSGGAAPTPSYRFLPGTCDRSRLSPVWQQTLQAAAGKPLPWLLAVDDTGHTVLDRAWPASVAETLAALQTCGGP